jgi:hypothetical protein
MRPNRANDNHGKRHLIQEWGHIRGRWKRRKYDLRAEADVGGAVRSSFEVVLRRGRRRYEPTRRLDSSRELNSVFASESRTARTVPRTGDESPSTLTDRLDDWARGYQTPSARFCFWDREIVPKATRVVPSLPTNPSSTTLGCLPATAAKRTGDSSFRSGCFPSPVQRAPKWFIHSRSLQFVVTGALLREANLGPTRTKTHQQLVAYLWDLGCLQCVSHASSIQASRQRGYLLRLFTRFRWKRRLEAAISLGIASFRCLHGPLKRFGERDSHIYPKLQRSKTLACLIQMFAWGTPLSEEFRPIRGKSSALSEEESARPPGVFSTTPSFPHDVHLVSLGPEDLYHNSYCSRDGLSRLACQAVLSTVLRASVRKAEGTPNFLIASMNDVLMELNQGNVQKSMSANGGRLELPLIDYAFALDSACALSSNGFPTNDLLNSGRGGEREAMPIAATPFVDRWLHANGPMFAKVQVRLNLLNVVHCLPKFLSASFLQSLDAGENQTAFDAMRRFLDHLEASGVLIEAGSSTSCSKSVPVQEIESMLYGASTRLMKILERRPLDLTCQCWHLATLAACVVLCSGNRVESEAAHRFPSGSTNHEVDCNAILSDMENGSVPHELRRKLPKFGWLRFQTASAFRLLLSESVNQSQAARWHLAVVSFLEWRQVVAFLLASKMNERNIRQIQHEYERHAVWLSSYTNTAESPVVGPQEMCHVAVDGFARLLESYPSGKDHWVQLVRELGHFRDPTSDKRHPSFNCSNDAAPLDDTWWGSSRISWWDVCILSQSSAKYISAPNLSNDGCSAQRGALSALPPTTDPFEWLGDGILEQEDTHAQEERNRNFSVCLSFTRSRTVRSHINTAAERQDSPSMTSAFELDLLKLFIRGHLHSTTDPEFEARVVSLAQDSWDVSNGVFLRNSGSFSALLCLHHKGLNLATIFHRAGIPAAMRAHAVFLTGDADEGEVKALRARVIL